MSDIESLFGNQEGFDLDLEGFQSMPSGEEMSDEEALEAGKRALDLMDEEIKESFDQKLLEEIEKTMEARKHNSDWEIHDYMGFNEIIRDSIQNLLLEDNSPNEVSVIVASDTNKNWLNDVEDAIKDKESGTVVIVFGKNFNGYEQHKANVKLGERLQDHSGWETMRELKDVFPPHTANKEGIERAIQRTTWLVKK